MTTETDDFINENGALAAALAKAQLLFPPISRDKTVTVQTRTGGSYTFKYAPLDGILAAVRKPLAENGLAISQLLDGEDLVTMLLHKDGARLYGRVSLPRTGGDTVQALGSAITYLRRYSIQAILGIAAEEDDDGNQAAGNTATFAQPQTPAGFPEGTRPPIIPPDVETEELVGNFPSHGGLTAGMVRNGTATEYKLQPRKGPDGLHAIGFRMEFKDEKTIPQVLVEGPAGEALFLATSTNPAALLDTRLEVKGRLFNVRRPGRQSYKRLKVTEWENADYSYPAKDEPAIEEPPADIPLFGETEPAA